VIGQGPDAINVDYFFFKEATPHETLLRTWHLCPFSSHRSS